MDERVAVVAVHGVGDHQPMSTSAGLAQQLLHFYPSQFTPFACTPLQIPVDTTGLPIPAEEHVPTDKPRAALKQSVGSRATAHAAAFPSAQTADIQFTDMALSGGAQYRSFYSTTRMSGSFQHANGKTELGLYELFWSDLSHGGIHGGFAVLSQMLQICLHIASLGRSAIATVCQSLPRQTELLKGLNVLSRTAAWGYWLLAMPIALANLLLLDLGVALLAHLIPADKTGRAGAAALLAVVAAALLGALLAAWLRRRDKPGWAGRHGMLLILILAFAYGGVLGATSSWETVVPPGTVVFVVALPLLIGVTTLLVRMYEHSRPGALLLWRNLVIGLAVWGLFLIWWCRDETLQVAALTWHFYLVEGLFALLVVIWGVLYANNLLLFGAACWCSWKAGAGKIRQAVDTSLLAATIPAPLLLTVVLTLWAVAYETLAARRFEVMDTPIQLLFTTVPASRHSLIEHMHHLIELSASNSFIPYLLVFLSALICALMALFPSVVAEIKPRARRTDAAATRGMWHWLSQGFGLLHVAKWLCVLGFIFVIPAGVAGQYVGYDYGIPATLGPVMGGGILAFVALTKLSGVNALGKVSTFFARLRVLIDTLIDVDNWLRERPVGNTPRLHIMARYVSLLRHLQSEGYQRLVLVCHSQGTVITADLLRYLQARNPALLQRFERIDLLTLGSPLRQLYAARFPGIYEWAINPQLASAGLASWQNGYGSGDYVGRNLWDAAKPSELWTPGRHPPGREFCTGAIAHTHYFDNHSPQVAAAVVGLL
jgi:hypothetical protein